MADESVPKANGGPAVPGTGDVAERPAGAVSRSGEAVPRGELRASHEDRDRVVELLRVAAGDGRLTAEELDERVEAALTARTYNELASLLTDLPSAPGAAVSAPGAEPRELVRIVCEHGTTGRWGSWAVPRRLEVRIKGGNVTLDFTDAEITSPTLHIDADMHAGNLTLLTRPGIMVSTDDLAIYASNVKAGPVSAAAPAKLRIDVSGQARHSNILVRPPRPPRPPRRTFWQWLTRQPRPAALPPRPS